MIGYELVKIRSVLELAVPAWHSSITSSERSDIERVQKTAAHVILGMGYRTYASALELLDHEMLEAWRAKLCTKFVTKSAKHVKYNNWFNLNTRTTVTRQPQPKYCPVFSSTTRFYKSPISYLTQILNEKFKK